jgi:hypothetical protein
MHRVAIGARAQQGHALLPDRRAVHSIPQSRLWPVSSAAEEQAWWRVPLRVPWPAGPVRPSSRADRSISSCQAAHSPGPEQQTVGAVNNCLIPHRSPLHAIRIQHHPRTRSFCRRSSQAKACSTMNTAREGPATRRILSVYGPTSLMVLFKRSPCWPSGHKAYSSRMP